ncbi:COG1470 family protein [Microbacterium sp. JZ31]|uniref:COG1470 family protein n=1 Tax=Microbacterium sp. JZ31 TaxID=1906274 RepID=UPI0019347DDD|nr:hypothetical protein [Microbacterium sp. JZ31]
MRLLLAIIFFCILVMAPELDATAHAADETGSIGIRLVDIPATAQDDPRAHTYVVDHLVPGATIQRRIEVSNDTDAEQAVRVYAGAADIREGAFVGRDGDAANELTGWTSVADPVLRLAPGEIRQTLVTVAVPDGASAGEHYGVVWAEVRSAPDAETAVVTASRVGVRMYLSVGQGGEPASDFRIDTIAALRDADGAPAVIATVTNSGQRALDLSGVLRLENGPSGLAAGPFDAEGVTTLAPGTSGDLVVTLGDELPDGPWTAVLEARSGTLSREARATLTFPDEGRTVSEVEHASSPNLLLPMSVGVFLILLISGSAWALRRWHGGR